MKNRILIVLFALFVGVFATSSTQAQETKIGYVNLDLILAYMPEMNNANKQLQVYQQKLEEDLQKRQGYLETKYQDYVSLAQEGAAQEVLQPLEQELQRLDGEVKQKAAESEQRLMQKRQELMAPLSEKIQEQIDILAEEEGYDLILNSVDGTGNSIVLFSKATNELSERLMAKLGIEIPTEEK